MNPTDDTKPTPSPATTATNMQAELADRSQYIRTMAKDMASLAGTPAPTAALRRPGPSTLPKREETFSGVTTAVSEQPFFEKSQAAVAAPEVVTLPTMQEAGSVMTPAVDPTREAVLERLRQKVGESAQMSIQQTPAPMPAPTPKVEMPPVQPAATEWSAVPSPAPQFAPFSEPVPARMPQVSKETYREPIDTYVPPRPIAPPTSAPEAFHTYTSDFADRIDTKGASSFSVLAAEQDARAVQAPVLTQKKGSPVKALVAIGSGILLLVLAGGGIFATYNFVMTMKDTPLTALTVPSIVTADEYRELSGSGSDLIQSLAAAANGALVPGNILVTYILTQNTDGSGTLLAAPAGGGLLIRALQLAAPDILLRNIAEESTVGVVNAGGDTKAFFALRVDSYERTYAGMLTWEPLMARDLALLYPLYPAASEPVPESTATTTATSSVQQSYATPVQAQARTRFEDAIVANHDVRILRDTSGKSLVLYGYADKRTLLIARDEAAFEALLPRLKND